MNDLALFAGAGGGILGGNLLGWTTICAVEKDQYARSILLARQDDGILDPFPIWDDVTTFDGRPWRGVVDVVSGGFPCQDIATCGSGKGLDGEKSGLWSEMARIIGEVRPRFVFVENSSVLVIRGLDRVLADLASMGFDAEWGIVGADDVGAPHKRKRIWIVGEDKGDFPDSAVEGLQGHGGQSELRAMSKKVEACRVDWWNDELSLDRVAHGVGHRVDRIKAIGNGQVPRVVEVAWQILRERLREQPDK